MKKVYLAALALTLISCFSSCGEGEEKKVIVESTGVAVGDSISYSSQRPVITISEANTDLESVENIERPAASKIVNSKYPLSNIFGIWTYDPEGPHADFVLDKEWFHVVDYDGDGNMPYIINQDSITVYYNDYVTKGLIKTAADEKMVIAWDGQDEINYVRWTQ